MSYKLSPNPCQSIGDPVPPMVPLRPSQNYTTGIEGMFYKDYVPIDEKEIIQEGTTYDLKDAELECNRIGCRMFIRDDVDGSTSFHIKYTPRRDCCGLKNGYMEQGGCQCERDCPTCTCKGSGKVNTFPNYYKNNIDTGLHPTRLGGGLKELLEDPSSKKSMIKIIMFMLIVLLIVNNTGSSTGGSNFDVLHGKTMECTQTIVNGNIVEDSCMTSSF